MNAPPVNGGKVPNVGKVLVNGRNVPVSGGIVPPNEKVGNGGKVTVGNGGMVKVGASGILNSNGPIGVVPNPLNRLPD